MQADYDFKSPQSICKAILLLQILCFEVQTLYPIVVQARCTFVPLYVTGLQTEENPVKASDWVWCPFSDSRQWGKNRRSTTRLELCFSWMHPTGLGRSLLWDFLSHWIRVYVPEASLFPFYPISESDFHSTLPFSYTSEILPTVFLCFLGRSVHSKPTGCILLSLNHSYWDLTPWPWLLKFCKQKAIRFHYSKVAVSQNLEVHTAVKRNVPLSHFCAICLTMQWGRPGSYSCWKQTSCVGPPHCIASRVKIREREVRVLG